MVGNLPKDLQIGRPEMSDIIEEAAIMLGRGSEGNTLLKGLASLLFYVSSEETHHPGELPLAMIQSAFDVAVEYLALGAANSESI
jgi:hypothetical protein